MADDGGLTSFQRRLRAIPPAARQAATQALVKNAHDVAGVMKQLAETSRDTGALIDSIEVAPPGETTPAYSQPGGSQVVPPLMALITVGNENVRYGHLVEFGTAERVVKETGKPSGKGPAQPFFWPAVRLTRKRVTGSIKRAIAKAIRDTGKTS